MNREQLVAQARAIGVTMSLSDTASGEIEFKRRTVMRLDRAPEKAAHAYSDAYVRARFDAELASVRVGAQSDDVGEVRLDAEDRTDMPTDAELDAWLREGGAQGVERWDFADDEDEDDDDGGAEQERDDRRPARLDHAPFDVDAAAELLPPDLEGAAEIDDGE